MEEGRGRGLRADELRKAIEGGDLDLYFQPIVSLADRSATMLEALPRWSHPERGILAPGDFIELAEANDLLVPLERWAIDRAVRQLERWRTGTASELEISINLSEAHVYEADLAESVAAADPAGGLGPRLGFEISESALTEAGGRTVQKLQALADLGVSLMVDDFFGVVEAPLLRDLPTTALKISRSIVAGIPDRTHDVENAAEAISLGRELGLATIASGVEGPGQLAGLRELGCQYAQGFFFSVPMPAEVLEERMVVR